MFKQGKKDSKAGGTQHSSANNWGDDEYAQLIDGVKKIYRTKIRPLEVTYNFEGKKNSIFFFFFTKQN